MKFIVRLTDSAIEDLDYFKKTERKIISDGIALYLKHEANVETRRRKPLLPNPISEWELRVRDYRVFYDFEGDMVKVVAVGHKEHNELFIRGRRVEL